MREKQKKQMAAEPMQKAAENLEQAMVGLTLRLLKQSKSEPATNRELGELTKLLKQLVDIRQTLAPKQEAEQGVQVVLAPEAEEFAQ